MPPEPRPHDPHWFDEVRPHEPAVRNYLRHKYPALDPDDIIQESYLKLFRFRALTSIRSFKTYFYAIANQTALAVFRKRARHPAPLSVDALPEIILLHDTPDAAELADDQQRLELVAQALATLPTRCRQIVELAIVHGFTAPQIALQLSLAESTVRVQLARGIEKCSAYLRAHR